MQKRLFFGFEISAPWPERLPAGRMINSHQRHLTVAFMGNVEWSKFSASLPSIPLPPFSIGLVGKFSRVCFLPSRQPHVVAWEISWLESEALLMTYQRQLTSWLENLDLLPKNAIKGWLPHVTLCRQPFQVQDWKASFQELPLFCRALHLYESLGNLNYQPIWTHPLGLPCEEIDHTADIAFLLRGETPEQLYIHAQLALAFSYPPLLPFLQVKPSLRPPIATKNALIQALSEIVASADAEIGIPFKGISLHGEFTQNNHLLQWEMIVDV